MRNVDIGIWSFRQKWQTKALFFFFIQFMYNPELEDSNYNEWNIFGVLGGPLGNGNRLRIRNSAP
jgi:hypothetical protein